ncbi:MAG: DUF1707 SHOCT-like domain-containing protein [Mycobacteriales bacterium]
MAIDQPEPGGARRYMPAPDAAARLDRAADSGSEQPTRGSGGGDQIRISDAERGAIIELLSHAATEGRLTWDEYAERTEHVYAARFQSDLVGIIDDLPHGPILDIPGNQPGGYGPRRRTAEVAPPRPLLHPVPQTLPSTNSHRVVAVLGNESRRGRWIVPQRMRVESYIGDCHIALNDATFEAHETTIEARAVCGSITIIVPEGVDVRLSGRAVLGSKEVRLRDMPPPGAPVITIICDVLLGSVKVRPPRWGWALQQLRIR